MKEPSPSVDASLFAMGLAFEPETARSGDFRRDADV